MAELLRALARRGPAATDDAEFPQDAEDVRAPRRPPDLEQPAEPTALAPVQLLRAVALPPLRPAAFFCAVVPPCDELLLDELDPDFLPPRLDAPGEFAIFAARSLDMPLSLSASYCFSFFTLGRLPGIVITSCLEVPGVLQATPAR